MVQWDIGRGFLGGHCHWGVLLPWGFIQCLDGLFLPGNEPEPMVSHQCYLLCLLVVLLLWLIVGRMFLQLVNSHTRLQGSQKRWEVIQRSETMIHIKLLTTPNRKSHSFCLYTR